MQLNYVANMPEKSPCLTSNCTWAFFPGTHISYSSTNFILAGFVLLAHAPEGQNTFEKYDMMETLGLNKTFYDLMYFKSHGAANEIGLTVPGLALTFGNSQIYTQDQSIMGWGAGDGIAAPVDVARFY